MAGSAVRLRGARFKDGGGAHAYHGRRASGFLYDVVTPRPARRGVTTATGWRVHANNGGVRGAIDGWGCDGRRGRGHGRAGPNVVYWSPRPTTMTSGAERNSGGTTKHGTTVYTQRLRQSSRCTRLCCPCVTIVIFVSIVIAVWFNFSINLAWYSGRHVLTIQKVSPSSVGEASTCHDDVETIQHNNF